MRIRKTSEAGVAYCPDFLDNRDKEDNDPEKVFVYLIPLTKSVENKVNRKMSARLDKLGRKPKPSGIAKVQQQAQRDTFMECVVKIEGIICEDESGNEVPMTLDWVYDNAPTAMLEDILSAIQDMSHLSEGLKKA